MSIKYFKNCRNMLSATINNKFEPWNKEYAKKY